MILNNKLNIKIVLLFFLVQFLTLVFMSLLNFSEFIFAFISSLLLTSLLEIYTSFKFTNSNYSKELLRYFVHYLCSIAGIFIANIAFNFYWALFNVDSSLYYISISKSLSVYVLTFPVITFIMLLMFICGIFLKIKVDEKSSSH